MDFRTSSPLVSPFALDIVHEIPLKKHRTRKHRLLGCMMYCVCMYYNIPAASNRSPLVAEMETEKWQVMTERRPKEESGAGCSGPYHPDVPGTARPSISIDEFDPRRPDTRRPRVRSPPDREAPRVTFGQLLTPTTGDLPTRRCRLWTHVFHAERGSRARARALTAWLNMPRNVDKR